VLGDVPKSERCRCREQGAPKQAARATAKKGAPAPAPDTAIGRFKAWLKQ
jgi:hypothetical protein